MRRLVMMVVSMSTGHRTLASSRFGYSRIATPETLRVGHE
jgi:hypothetical protein